MYRDILKKFFPLSFEMTEPAKLIFSILIYAVAGVIGGLIISMFSWIPIFGIPFVALGSLVDIYVAAGIVIAVLSYLKIL